MKRILLTNMIASVFILLFALDPPPVISDNPVNAEPPPPAMKLTLAVIIALSNNVTLCSAYLDRYFNKIDAVGEEKILPACRQRNGR